eukprot:CAMPEP_0198199180 /NCGR_PEP_ID=MMETSP1445-20131203/2509_1 /TAXON_ID=36898 /ORGANISM="Pyramimonas sp., Strain CCMP2087" /LENGTH=58 /DNA_ID=CAMNT_0043868945 /DNA_START=92 /DNA_END=265 /DNA_ORIENTATION=+
MGGEAVKRKLTAEEKGKGKAIAVEEDEEEENDLTQLLTMLQSSRSFSPIIPSHWFISS